MENNNLYQDKELFARIVTDDATAFRQLFDKYFQLLLINAIKLVKSSYWAEEVAQETLLEVWENRSALNTIENPGGWLFRVAANKCLDKVRRREVELRAQYLINRTVYEKQTVEQTGHYDYDLLRHLIAEAVDRLPDQQKLAYKLQQEEELSYKEIAQRLGISPHTVRNHLIRAFRTIRNHLINEGELLILFLLFPFF